METLILFNLLAPKQFLNATKWRPRYPTICILRKSSRNDQRMKKQNNNQKFRAHSFLLLIRTNNVDLESTPNYSTSALHILVQLTKFCSFSSCIFNKSQLHTHHCTIS